MRHVETAGAGPLLVCLHGIGGSVATFTHQLTGLRERFRVVARDAPGYGRSADPTGYPGEDDYLGDIAGIIKGEGRGSAYILGMSWGGVLAMRFALAYPELVDGLILGDTTRGSGQTERQAVAMRGRPAELLSLGAEAFAAKRAGRLLSSAATADDIAAVATAMADAIRLPGYAYAARFMAESNLTRKLSAITVPTLIVYGAEDVVTGKAESVAIGAEIAGSTLVEIPGAGHLSNQEQPQAFNAAVLRFVDNLTS